MTKTPRTLTLGADATLADVTTRVNEFARDTIAALEARPRARVLVLDFVGGSINRDVMTDLRKAPIGAFVVGATVKASPQSSVGGPLYLDWTWVGPSLRIRGIAGLTGGVEYTVRVAVLED